MAWAVSQGGRRVCETGTSLQLGIDYYSDQYWYTRGGRSIAFSMGDRAVEQWSVNEVAGAHVCCISLSSLLVKQACSMSDAQLCRLHGCARWYESIPWVYKCSYKCFPWMKLFNGTKCQKIVERKLCNLRKRALCWWRKSCTSSPSLVSKYWTCLPVRFLKQKECILLDQHRWFFGCKKFVNCLLESIPIVVNDYARQLLNERSGFTSYHKWKESTPVYLDGVNNWKLEGING